MARKRAASIDRVGPDLPVEQAALLDMTFPLPRETTRPGVGSGSRSLDQSMISCDLNEMLLVWAVASEILRMSPQQCL